MLKLEQEDLEVLLDEIETAIQVQKTMLETTIEEDQTPETVEEFLELVSDSHTRIRVLESLYDRIKRELE